MTPHLIIECRFVAHSYSGIRLTADRREELDWPPAPGRLHQALMAAALTGLSPADVAVAPIMSALRWLERRTPPSIYASRISEGARSQPRVAIPQNNPKGSDLESASILLAPTKRATPAGTEPLCVTYFWALADEAEARIHLPALIEAAARMTYLGRAEDRVETAARIGVEPSSPEFVRWQPRSTGTSQLWLPREGTTDALERRFRAPVAMRERKPPAHRWMLAQPYAPTCPHGRLPVHVAIFQLFPACDDPDRIALSCDPELSGRWRSAVRGRVVEIASESSYWNNPSLATELLTGHDPVTGKHTTRPHLAIVPLPSLNLAGTADGRVRRVALLGFASPEIAQSAREVFETLCRALDGELIPELNGRLTQCDLNADKIWGQLLGVSRVWCSATPVAISRGFKVPRFADDGRALSSNERYQRKLGEWKALIKSSLRHIELPEQLIERCSIEITSSPLLPRTQRAELYRPPGEGAVLAHVRMEFPEPVTGPLLVGDRRYQGLGLFTPAEPSR